MADKGAPPPTTATSLYRLTGVDTLATAVRDKYLNDTVNFTQVACHVGDREALLVHGHMEKPRAA